MPRAVRHEALLRYARDIVTVVDPNGVVIYVNDAGQEMLGQDAEHARGRSSHSYVHPDDLELARSRRAWLLAEPGRSTTTVMRVTGRDGWRHVETTGVNLLHDPNVAGLLFVTRDVEERMRERAGLQRAVAGQQLLTRLGLQALTSPDVPALLVEVLTELAVLLDATDVTVAEGTLTPDVTVSRSRAESGPLADAAEFVVDLPTAAGGTLTVRGAQEDKTDRHLIGAVAELLTGVFAQEARQRAAVNDALHDRLTGLMTRPLLEDRLHAHLQRTASDVALLIVDLDRFKLVNDLHGHAAGDHVLAVVGPRLRESVRPTDSVCRWGGDEFVVLCGGGITEELLMDLADRVRRACGTPVTLPSGAQVTLSGSVGVARSQGLVDNAHDLLRAADAAMYAAKRLSHGLPPPADPAAPGARPSI